MCAVLNKDLNNYRKWVRCVRKKNKYTATYWDTGAVYYNKRTMQMSQATHETPVLLRDEYGALTAISKRDLVDNYTKLDGSSLCVREIGNGDIVDVCTRSVGGLWAFHARTDVYGYNGPFGINSSGTYNGSGDYVVCTGHNKPNLATAKVLSDVVFHELYEIKEDSKMFGLKNSMWTWRDNEYREADEALKALCDDITYGSDNLIPTFGDLGMLVSKQLLMLVCIYKYDMASIFQSYNAFNYTQLTRGEKADILRTFSDNPLKVSNVRIPMTYQSNKAMHCAIIPKLREIYDSERIMIKVDGGKQFTFERVLSYMCDTVLFNPENSPFIDILNVFMTLEEFEPTRNLSETCSHRDLERLKVLAMQVKAGDIPEQDPISIGDVRACRYKSLTKEKVGDVDYVKNLLNSAPALRSDDYSEWVSKVFNVKSAVEEFRKEEVEVKPKSMVAANEVVEPEPAVAEKEEVKIEQEPVPVVEEKKPVTFEQAMNPPEEPNDDVKMMHDVAYVYCELLGEDINQCRAVLQGFGIEKWSDFYRALPVYLRRRGKGIDENCLLEYCSSLELAYGDCKLRCDV